ncbi:GNAT family N-acetyltransferase [Paenibacillus sp. HJL G12]|uniref:GNAT family N-acetyltransferase n=1 Tax=Paenibacillus dendrobii TaxID=2691084 RepID=A0A7X3IHZ6_9BACL|nr:GNAT family N-acetyltransferase [Paenibacillus dendrobii]MWV44277.1 GNAT family N-acetyltransferase [Paenibacillus dendrobii]
MNEQQGNEHQVFTMECRDIILREYLSSDVEAIYALTQQPEIKQFLPDWDVPLAQRVDWIKNYETVENRRFLQAAAADGHIGGMILRLGIIEKATGEFIGWCNTGIKDELPEPNREIMYALSNRHTNKGYTTQAVQALAQYLFAYTDVAVLNAVALTHNHSSNKVIQKCGFETEGTIRIDDEEYNHYKLYKRKEA